MNAIDPEVVGLHKSKLTDIQIKSKEDAIRSFVGVLNNTANQAMIETTALNAAGGLIVANIANDFEEGVEIALNTIKDGKAMSLLEKFVKNTGDISKLREIVMAENILRKLVNNSQMAIDDGVYDVDVDLQKSEMMILYRLSRPIDMQRC